MVENTNRSEDIEASGIEDAIAALEVAGEAGGEAGKAGKVNRRALHMAFEERELAGVKEDYPGLKRSQYKEKIFEMWKKSPENPDNQLADA